jgi:hypothetical protein
MKDEGGRMKGNEEFEVRNGRDRIKRFRMSELE